jgi:CHAT domain-containing protein
MFRSERWIRLLSLLALIACTSIPTATSRTQDAARTSSDAAALQQRAIKRIEFCALQLRKTGDLQSVQNEFRQAEDELSRSYQDFIKSHNLAAAALSLHKLADVQRLLYRWQPAQQLYKEAFDLARRANHVGYQVKTLIGQARVASNGPKDYNTAINYLDEAIRLSEQGVDKKDLFDIYHLKSSALSSRRELAAAFDYASRAFSIASETNDPDLLFYGYFSRGGIYQSLGLGCDVKRGVRHCIDALDRAKSDLEQSLSLARKQGYDFFAEHLTKMLNANKLYREPLRDSDRYSQVVSNTRVFNPTHPREVYISEELYSPPEPFSPLQEIAIRAGMEIVKEDAAGFYQEAILLYSRGQVEASVKSFLKAVERLEADRRRLNDELGRSAFFIDKMLVFYDPILLLSQLNRHAEAFELMERSRSRLLADLLHTQDLNLAQPSDRTSYAESVKLRSRISQLQKDVLMRSAERQNVEQIAGTKKEIERLEGEYQDLISKVIASGSKLQELIASKPVSLISFQQLMKREGFEALSYLVLDGQVVLWHFSGDAIHARSVFLLREHLTNKIDSFRQGLRDRNVKFDEKVARELFLFLIQPALQWIKSDRLVIFPHENLHSIPFQALIDPATGRAFGERFNISYAPSASVLLRLKRSGSIRQGQLLAAADPTSVEAKREVSAISKLYPTSSRIISDALVKEVDLKRMVAGHDLIHLSVHGKFLAQEPLLSHLKLDQGGSDDGQLTAAEMFGLPLQNAHLVVLSACETGQAKATRANEVIGMERALLYAGANNLVLSSWKVDAASTALWMETFYREAQTKPLVEAARLALIAVKNDPRYSHPYYWGPFLMIGR